jgi:hypothetical protein
MLWIFKSLTPGPLRERGELTFIFSPASILLGLIIMMEERACLKLILYKRVEDSFLLMNKERRYAELYGQKKLIRQYKIMSISLELTIMRK